MLPRLVQAPAPVGVPVLVDGSQAAVQMPATVRDFGCDFYADTGIKHYPAARAAFAVSNPPRLLAPMINTLTEWCAISGAQIAQRRTLSTGSRLKTVQAPECGLMVEKHSDTQ